MLTTGEGGKSEQKKAGREGPLFARSEQKYAAYTYLRTSDLLPSRSLEHRKNEGYGMYLRRMWLEPLYVVKSSMRTALPSPQFFVTTQHQKFKKFNQTTQPTGQPQLRFYAQVLHTPPEEPSWRCQP